MLSRILSRGAGSYLCGLSVRDGHVSCSATSPLGHPSTWGTVCRGGLPPVTRATLNRTLPLHHLPCLPWMWPGQKLLPWMFGCLQQGTWSCSCGQHLLSHISLFIKKFMFCLLFFPPEDLLWEKRLGVRDPTNTSSFFMPFQDGEFFPQGRRTLGQRRFLCALRLDLKTPLHPHSCPTYLQAHLW